MELAFKDLSFKDKKLSFKFPLEKIIGITGDNRKDMIDYLTFKKKNFSLFLDQKKCSIEEMKEKISYVEEDALDKYFQNTVYEMMYYEIRRKGLKLKDPRKKIKESFKIVGLNDSMNNRLLKTLSSSEKSLLRISLGLLSNPEIFMIEEPFLELDKQNKKMVNLLFRRMKEEYHKTIIILSDDIDSIYQDTDYVVLLHNNKVVSEGDTKEILSDQKWLKINKCKIPEMVDLTTYIWEKKQVNLEYHRDIRDIIKDIYKHV